LETKPLQVFITNHLGLLYSITAKAHFEDQHQHE
jgi:hypothetical protein